MYSSLSIFKHHTFGDGTKPGNFPIGSSSDYSAINKITTSEIEKWPRIHLQMLMDYCLSKEIFEVAAVIRDAATSKGMKLRTV